MPHLIKKTALAAAAIATTSDEVATLRERNSVLARENARLNSELITLKHSIESSIRRTALMSSFDSAGSQKLPDCEEHSPSFDLAADLTQVFPPLKKLLFLLQLFPRTSVTCCPFFFHSLVDSLNFGSFRKLRVPVAVLPLNIVNFENFQPLMLTFGLCC